MPAAKAIARYNYPGVYRGVFQSNAISSDTWSRILRFGKPHQFGLEAGSKPELMIAGYVKIHPERSSSATAIKTGNTETAMLATRLGDADCVIEQIEEVELVITASRQLGIQPILGVRAKLSTQGVGRWGGSSSDRAKFGLTIPEIIEAVDQLRSANLLESLQLLHFHIGSQISAINVVKDAIREASQIYVS